MKAELEANSRHHDSPQITSRQQTHCQSCRRRQGFTRLSTPPVTVLLMAVETRWYLAIAALLVTMGVRGLMV